MPVTQESGGWALSVRETGPQGKKGQAEGKGTRPWAPHPRAEIRRPGEGSMEVSSQGSHRSQHHHSSAHRMAGPHRGSPMSCTPGGGSRCWWWALAPQSPLQNRGQWHLWRCTRAGVGHGGQGCHLEHRARGHQVQSLRWLELAPAASGSVWRGRLDLRNEDRQPGPQLPPGVVQRVPPGMGPRDTALGLAGGSAWRGSQQYCR